MTQRDDSFLDRSAGELLDLFAAGRNTPGAGSAAALIGALAGSLIQAVARYTLKAQGPMRERAEILLKEAGERCERLRAAVDEDATAFNHFWKNRTDEALKRATDLPMAVAEDCLALAEMGIELYDQGFRNARGEASAAALSAVAGGEAALHAARLNVGFAGAAPWTEGSRSEIGLLGRRLRALREQVESRIGTGGEPA
jgi:formiminotetrahydrofolate cyclodeaminase